MTVLVAKVVGPVSWATVASACNADLKVDAKWTYADIRFTSELYWQAVNPDRHTSNPNAVHVRVSADGGLCDVDLPAGWYALEVQLNSVPYGVYPHYRRIHAMYWVELLDGHRYTFAELLYRRAVALRAVEGRRPRLLEFEGPSGEYTVVVPPPGLGNMEPGVQPPPEPIVEPPVGGAAIGPDTARFVAETDSDGDTLANPVEGVNDTDRDGTPNYLDTDSDGDGVLDSVEGSQQLRGRPPAHLTIDADGDGVTDTVEYGADGTTDTDGDGTPDWLDPNSNPTGSTTDTDGDGIIDTVEQNGDATRDTDGDGTPDHQDSDADGDGMSDGREGVDDLDGDGVPNFQDTDSDGDGIPDASEKGTGFNPKDSDSDGIPDAYETDSDNDGIPDATEAGPDPANPRDTDNDGTPDYQDPDSDGDGVGDLVEVGSDPANPVDSNGDGTPDYLDPAVQPTDVGVAWQPHPAQDGATWSGLNTTLTAQPGEIYALSARNPAPPQGGDQSGEPTRTWKVDKLRMGVYETHARTGAGTFMLDLQALATGLDTNMPGVVAGTSGLTSTPTLSWTGVDVLSYADASTRVHPMRYNRARPAEIQGGGGKADLEVRFVNADEIQVQLTVTESPTSGSLDVWRRGNLPGQLGDAFSKPDGLFRPYPNTMKRVGDDSLTGIDGERPANQPGFTYSLLTVAQGTPVGSVISTSMRLGQTAPLQGNDTTYRHVTILAGPKAQYSHACQVSLDNWPAGTSTPVVYLQPDQVEANSMRFYVLPGQVDPISMTNSMYTDKAGNPVALSGPMLKWYSGDAFPSSFEMGFLGPGFYPVPGLAGDRMTLDADTFEGTTVVDLNSLTGRHSAAGINVDNEEYVTVVARSFGQSWFAHVRIRPATGGVIV